MPAPGTFVRLALVSCASAAATALVSLPFLTPAAAMSPLAESYPPAAPLPVVPSAVAAAPALPVGPAPGIIRRIDNREMQVTFTFDACATNSQPNGFDRAVLRVLQRERVPATVFTSGRWVEFHPDAMRELAAEPLIEFANHSYDHAHMDRLDSQAIAEEIDRTEAALGRYGRQSVAFRPPFGDFNQLVLDVVRDKRLPAVLWDVVSGDPSARATPDAMIRSVVRQTRSGSIIIFHINGRETKTAEALPPIFRQLRARGFQFVHLSALLGTGSPVNVGAPTAPVAAPVPAAAPPSGAPVSPDDDDVMPLSTGDGLSDVNSLEGANSEVTARRPSLARARSRRGGSTSASTSVPTSASSLMPASVTPPPFGLREAAQISAVTR